MTSGSPRDEPRLRVLIANEHLDRLERLVPVIEGLGHEVVARAVDADGVGPLSTAERADVAIVSVGDDVSHALHLIERIFSEASCPVIALRHAPSPGFGGAASEQGVFAVVSDREPEEWRDAIAVALRRFADYHDLRRAFTRRATIERANGILMERHTITGEVAFGMLRDSARRSNRKVIELAGAVIDGHSLPPAGPG